MMWISAGGGVQRYVGEMEVGGGKRALSRQFRRQACSEYI